MFRSNGECGVSVIVVVISNCQHSFAIFDKLAASRGNQYSGCPNYTASEDGKTLETSVLERREIIPST